MKRVGSGNAVIEDRPSRRDSEKDWISRPKFLEEMRAASESTSSNEIRRND